MRPLSRPPVCPLPAWKQALRFTREPLELLTECSRSLGDIFCLRLPGPEYWTFLTSPNAARQLFKEPREHVPAGEIHARFLGALFGVDATFCLDGAAHRQRQKLLIPLLSAKANRNSVPTLRDMIDTRIEGWPTDRPVRLLSELHRLSLDFLVRLMFGPEDAHFRERLVDAFTDLSDLGARSKLVVLPKLQWNLGRFSPWGKILHRRKITRALIRTHIREVRRNLGSEPQSILEDLLRGTDDSGEGLRDETLIDEVMNLLFAGHETTGAFLTWCAEALYRHPSILETLRNHLTEALGNRPFGPEHLDRIPYLNAVVHETFRYRPVGPFSAFRKVQQAIELNGEKGRFQIPAGDVVAHAFPIMAMRPDLYEDPRAFKPERFLQGELTGPGWAPFGGGGRVCTGRSLALMELQVVIAGLVQRVDLEFVHDETRIERCGHLLSPADGLPVRVRPLPA